jgi:hypothetical protein
MPGIRDIKRGSRSPGWAVGVIMPWKRDGVEVEVEGASGMAVSGSDFMAGVEDCRNGVGVEAVFRSFFLCDRLLVFLK